MSTDNKELFTMLDKNVMYTQQSTASHELNYLAWFN